MPNASELAAMMHRAAQAGVEKAAQLVLEEAQRLAPVGTPPDDGHPGELRDSGHVEPVANGATVTFDTPYAKKQELDRRLHHTHGQALYLETALKTVAPKLLEVMAQEIRAGLHG